MAQLTPQTITLKAEHRDQLIDLAACFATLEICGMVAGSKGISTLVIPIPSSDRSPTRYTMQPEAMIAAFWELEKENLELIAFYHSHPHSFPRPSRTDMVEANYPNTPHIIIGKEKSAWILRAFLINRKSFQEVPISIISQTL